MTFIGKGFEEGDDFTNSQLSRLIKSYDDVGGQKGVSGILIGLGINPKRTRQSRQQPTTRREQ